MVLIVSASLPHDGIFFAGEKFTCTITLTHPKPATQSKQYTDPNDAGYQGKKQELERGHLGTMSDMTMKSFDNHHKTRLSVESTTLPSTTSAIMSAPTTNTPSTGTSLTGALKHALGISSFRTAFFGTTSTSDSAPPSATTNSAPSISTPISPAAAKSSTALANTITTNETDPVIPKVSSAPTKPSAIHTRRPSEIDSDRSRGIISAVTAAGRRKSYLQSEVEHGTSEVLDLNESMNNSNTEFSKLELKPSQSFTPSEPYAIGTPANGTDLEDSPKKKKNDLSSITEEDGYEETPIAEAGNVIVRAETPAIREPLFEPEEDGSRETIFRQTTKESPPQSFVYEELAWGFAQTSGQFTIDPTYIKASPFDTLKQRVMYRPAGSGSIGPGGGGSITAANHPGSTAGNSSYTFPVLSTPPTILFCDLSLAEGQSKSFVYTIDLPPVLPPSHRGKVSRFVYKLIVGVQKVGENLKSQIVSIPFRVLNRTNPGGIRIPFDVLAPVIKNKDEALISDVANMKNSLQNLASNRQQLASQLSPTLSQLSINDDDETTTQQNVQIVCQVSSRISYDICKTNDHVARVTIPRSSFRLSETVSILVDFTGSSIPCYQISVTLYSFEQVESNFSLKSKQQVQSYTRRIHDQAHHFTLNARRSVISLVIPANASCDFQTSLTSVSYAIKLEFITGKYGRFYSASGMYDGFQHQIGFPDVEVEPFDCVIPIKVYGGFKVLTKNIKSFHFEVGK